MLPTVLNDENNRIAPTNQATTAEELQVSKFRVTLDRFVGKINSMHDRNSFFSKLRAQEPTSQAHKNTATTLLQEHTRLQREYKLAERAYDKAVKLKVSPARISPLNNKNTDFSKIKSDFKNELYNRLVMPKLMALADFNRKNPEINSKTNSSNKYKRNAFFISLLFFAFLMVVDVMLTAYRSVRNVLSAFSPTVASNEVCPVEPAPLNPLLNFTLEETKPNATIAVSENVDLPTCPTTAPTLDTTIATATWVIENTQINFTKTSKLFANELSTVLTYANQLPNLVRRKPFDRFDDDTQMINIPNSTAAYCSDDNTIQVVDPNKQLSVFDEAALVAEVIAETTINTGAEIAPEATVTTKTSVATEDAIIAKFLAEAESNSIVAQPPVAIQATNVVQAQVASQDPVVAKHAAKPMTSNSWQVFSDILNRLYRPDYSAAAAYSTTIASIDNANMQHHNVIDAPSAMHGPELTEEGARLIADQQATKPVDCNKDQFCFTADQVLLANQSHTYVQHGNQFCNVDCTSLFTPGYTQVVTNADATFNSSAATETIAAAAARQAEQAAAEVARQTIEREAYLNRRRQRSLR
jgi:hypothetical protein